MHTPKLGEKLPPSWHTPYLVTNIGLISGSEVSPGGSDTKVQAGTRVYEGTKEMFLCSHHL